MAVGHLLTVDSHHLRLTVLFLFRGFLGGLHLGGVDGLNSSFYCHLRFLHGGLGCLGLRPCLLLGCRLLTDGRDAVLLLGSLFRTAGLLLAERGILLRLFLISLACHNDTCDKVWSDTVNVTGIPPKRHAPMTFT